MAAIERADDGRASNERWSKVNRNASEDSEASQRVSGVQRDAGASEPVRG